MVQSLRTLLSPCVTPTHAELQRFRETLIKPVVIYGAGFRGKLIASLCREFHIPIAAVCDKNLAGSEVAGLGAIQSFPEAIRSLTDYQVVVASVPYQNEIEQYVKSVVPGCEIYAFEFPYMIEVGNTGPADYKNFLKENLSVLETLSERFSDELSRETLYAVIKARLTWNYRLLENIHVEHQYFLPDVVPLLENEVFYDCGAWMGDSLTALTHHTHGNFKKAVCFEPGEEARQKLYCKFQGEIEAGKVALVPKAVSDQETVLYFRPQAAGSHLLEARSAGKDCVKIKTTTIDQVAQGEDVTYIKMDVEGAELAALKGAKQTIQRCRPKLAICVYHKVEDLVEIPQYIDELQLEYRYFLRHHSSSLCETVFYAIPD